MPMVQNIRQVGKKDCQTAILQDRSSRYQGWEIVYDGIAHSTQKASMQNGRNSPLLIWSIPETFV
jgi:hypothetical protein